MDWTPARIRDARESRGWTQKQFATAAKVAVRTVVSWESGESRPRSRAGMLDRLFADDQPPAPSLADFSDAELIGEIATRFSRTRRRVDRPGRAGRLPDHLADRAERDSS